MATIAESLFRESQFGEVIDVPRAGSALEHPLVFDATARELKDMQARGEIEIVDEHSSQFGDDWVIDRLSFRRLGDESAR
jgi:hypothetical protein